MLQNKDEIVFQEINELFSQFMPFSIDERLDKVLSFYQRHKLQYKKLSQSILLIHFARIIQQINFNDLSKLYEQLYYKLTDIKLQQSQISSFYQNLSLVSLQSLNNIEQFGIYDVDQERLNEILFETYNDYSRIPKLEQVFLWFPSYLDKYQKFQKEIIYGEMFLNIEEKYFLTIIAVSAYGCDYLYERLCSKFIEYGGDKEWIEIGYQVIPQRIQIIIDISLKLAYSPWNINPDDILSLQNFWSKNQIIKIFILICFYQSLACLCLSNNILPEIDSGKEIKESFIPSKEQNIDEKQLEAFLQTMLQAQDKIEQQTVQIDLDDISKPEKKIKIIKLKFRKYFSQELFKNDENSCKNAHQMKSGDFDWISAFSLINVIDPQLATLLHDKFDYTLRMTNQTLSNLKNIDTKPFRRAVYIYTSSLLGYYNEDYDYTQINKLLPVKFKQFLKNVTSTPFVLERDDFDSSFLNLKSFEFCHITMLVCDQKFKISLMMAINNILQLF